MMVIEKRRKGGIGAEGGGGRSCIWFAQKEKNDLSLVTQGRVPGGEEERAMCTTMGLAGALLCLY